MTTNYVALDTETFLIGPGAVAPKLVCASFAQFEEDHSDECGTSRGAVCDCAGGRYDTMLLSTADEGLENILVELFQDTETHLVLQAACSDLSVLVSFYPSLMPLVWQALEDERIHDTKIREKLLNLAVTGSIGFLENVDGTKTQIKYGLKELVLKYTGEDISQEKEEKDGPRLNFHTLDGQPASEYPIEFSEYAQRDASLTLKVFRAQEKEDDLEMAFVTEGFQVGVDFALRLSTCWGMAIDPVAKGKIEAMIARELAPENMNLLIAEGILVPAVPPRPHKNGALNKDGTPKMTVGEPEHIYKKALVAHVEKLCAKHELPLRVTDHPTHPQTSTEDEFIAEIEGFSETLQQYRKRAKLQKIVTTELPRMSGEIVHFPFDVLKETGRTSSAADKLYPSANGQNIDPRVRPCYVARPGHLLVSCDYSGIELVSFGWKKNQLFEGESTLYDLVNSGKDSHSFLGGLIAHSLHTGFRQNCEEHEITEPFEIYDSFKMLEQSEEESIQDFFKLWRKFGKVSGLSFPGGMGIERFIAEARKYELTVDREMAESLKRVWVQSDPCNAKYFDWIRNSCTDPRNRGKYGYFSPLGMYRAGCDYTDACNGAALQTPTGEGAKLAVFQVSRACYDETQNSILYGCHLPDFIHDELLAEIPDDPWAHERAYEIARIMEESMKQVLTGMVVKAQPVLMRSWNKKAKAVFDADRRLCVWEPTKEQEA